MKFPTPQSKKTLAQVVIKTTENTLLHLYSRWLDEKEYEDFSEYEKVLRDAVSKIDGVTFLKGTQRPFGFQFQTPDGDYHYSIRTEGNKLVLKWKLIQPKQNIKQFLSSSDKNNTSTPQSKNRKKQGI